MAKVKPVPEGCHTVTPHMVVRGAAEALKFYEKAFGAKESVCMPGPDGKSILHAEMQIGDSLIFLVDEFPGMGCLSPLSLKGTTVTIHLYVDNVDAAFNKAVAAGATVKMPLMDMFWGDRYGKVTDPYGHEWSLAQHVEDVPPEEMAKRGEEAMKKHMAGQPA